MNTVAIKVQTRSGERYFNGWGKGGSVQTAWSLAGAQLFLNGNGTLDIVTNALDVKKKKYSLVIIEEKQEKVEHDEPLIWVTQDEFKRLTIFDRIKPVNLDYFCQFALDHCDQSKGIMNKFLEEGDDEQAKFFREDAIEFVQFTRALNREIRRQGGL